MTNTNMQQYKQRVAGLAKKRRAANQGVIYSVAQDGLIIARPRRHVARRPLHFIVIAVIGVLAFKVVLYASLGSATYNERVGALADGNAVERAGAWVMKAGDLTVWLANEGRALF